MATKKRIHQMTIAQWERAFPDDDACCAKVSDKYLPLYVAEFQFRRNNRENANIFGEALLGC